MGYQRDHGAGDSSGAPGCYGHTRYSQLQLVWIWVAGGILAIEKGDYERAYDYLAEKQFKSSKETKPSFEEFKDNFLFNENNAGYQIGETVISDTTTISSKTAHVEITIMEGSSGIFFDRHYDYMEKARLIEEEGKWKITHMPYAYWGWDWYAEE